MVVHDPPKACCFTTTVVVRDLLAYFCWAFLAVILLQDEEQKLLHIKILDDDEHEPDTYFDVELYDPTTEDSNARSFVCSRTATQYYWT